MHLARKSHQIVTWAIPAIVLHDEFSKSCYSLLTREEGEQWENCLFVIQIPTLFEPLSTQTEYLKAISWHEFNQI